MEKRLGVLIGGSGLIGGALTHYFKTKAAQDIDFLAPNSKRLSLRVTDDLKRYFRQHQPDFIINAAIAAIDSDPQLAFETNYLGSINLAKVALAMRIPYIHFSSAAVLPMAENVSEEQVLPLGSKLSNYAKSKLMAEMTLQHMRKLQGLDYTIVRLAVVYGKHDHKIQGFHRLLFSLANQSMPFLLTSRGVSHSYSNTRKLPFFIDHVIRNRQEFGGQTVHFVDRQPVELAKLILTTKSYLGLSTPKEIYVPYTISKIGKMGLLWLIRKLGRIGVVSKMPAELIFMENFYQTQTLSARQLMESSFVDPLPEVTVYSEIPALIEYYITRWEHLNLISTYNVGYFDPKKRAELFLNSPEEMLASIHHDSFASRPDFEDFLQ